ncbi:hypothetical protein Nmel_002938 [Mimus melanotis]
MKLTWTVLLHGFKRVPTIFGNQLTKEIGKLENLDRTLLQRVDDILQSIKTERKHLNATVSLLNFLG